MQRVSCDPDPVHAKPAGNQTWDWQEKAGKLVWRFKRLPAGAEATLKVCWVGGILGCKPTRQFGWGLPDWSLELSAGGRLTGQGMVMSGNLGSHVRGLKATVGAAACWSGQLTCCSSWQGRCCSWADNDL